MSESTEQETVDQETCVASSPGGCLYLSVFVNLVSFEQMIIGGHAMQNTSPILGGV